MRLKAAPVLMMFVLLIPACSAGSPVVETQESTDLPVPGPTLELERVEVLPTATSAEQSLVVTDSQFVILQGSSEARFYIDEVLRGQPKTVEGITQQISGGLMIESLDPLSVNVQTIEIQAGSFVTDSSFRNRAISDAILQSGRFPTITFTPTEFEGLPESGSVGETYDFEVTGDLSIRDNVLPVTFVVSLTAVSADEFIGTASTTINRTDYGLNIPSVPQIANVSEQVVLEFDFRAARDI